MTKYVLSNTIVCSLLSKVNKKNLGGKNWSMFDLPLHFHLQELEHSVWEITVIMWDVLFLKMFLAISYYFRSFYLEYFFWVA